MQPLAQQLLGERRVATARAHEVRQRADHRVAELWLGLEQRAGSGREADALTLELGERVAPRRYLRQRLLRLAASRPLVRLLLFELRHAATRALERFDGLDRLVRLRCGAMRERAHFHRGCPLRRIARQPLLRRLRHLLAELGPLPFERRALALERPKSLGPALQVCLELTNGVALREQPVTAGLLERGAAGELPTDGRQVPLGRRVLGGRGLAFSLRLHGSRLLLLPPLPRRGSALPRIA